MLRKSFLSAVNGWLSRRNNLVINITRYSTLIDSSHVNSEEAKYINSTKVKKETEKIKLETLKKKESTLYDKYPDIVNYMQSINPDIIDICPKSLIRTKETDTNVLYMIDRNAAAKFVSMIIDDLSKNMSFITELNPGFGILTTELLKAGVPYIHMYEARNNMHLILDKLCGIYSDKLDLKYYNLVKISQLIPVNKETDGKLVEKAFQGLETKKWTDETCMQVIGATNTQMFFRHLIYSLLFRNSLMSYGRPVFYLATSPSLWHKYTCGNNNLVIYTARKVLFQTMFNFKHLGTLDRKAFLPWPKRPKWKQKNKTWINSLERMDYDEMYVIRLEPRSDIYSILSQEDWLKFWYFLRHNMRKRCNRVIPTLENWIPGCGLRLIAKNYTMYVQFGDLKPEQFVDLFKEFKSWPEYETCGFLSSMDSFLKGFTNSTFNKVYNEDDDMFD